jgi:carbon-monoxide dehydrogenase medium subunit
LEINMKRFDYLAPRSLKEALDLMARHPEALPLAGGTDLLVQIKDGRRLAQSLLSLRRVSEVRKLIYNGKLVIGAAISLDKIATESQILRDYTALAMGASLIGSIQIRNMATVGGNLCNAAPSADTAPPLLVLGAQVVIASRNGERCIPLEEFFLGPGKTALKPGELLKEIVVPNQPERSGSFYLRQSPRARMDIAITGVAATVTLDEANSIVNARLALGAVAPTPMRATKAEAVLVGHSPTDVLLHEAAILASQEAQPIDDLRASAEYRTHLVSVLVERAIRGALSNVK